MGREETENYGGIKLELRMDQGTKRRDWREDKVKNQ